MAPKQGILRSCGLIIFRVRYCRCRYVTLGGILLVVFLLYRHSKVTEEEEPVTSNVTCLPVLPLHMNGVYSTADTPNDRAPVNCGALFSENSTEVLRTRGYKWCYRTRNHSESVLLDLTRNCSHFYPPPSPYNFKVTESELALPIAFNILVYKNIEQIYRLIRIIYRPHNYYCVHIDKKSPDRFRKTLEALVKCYPNVFISSESIDVQWAEYTVLEAELVCLRDLWKYKKWRYFINLTGQEFPLKTNWELVQILQAYNGANDIDGTPHSFPSPEFENKYGHVIIRHFVGYRRPIIWTKYSWRREWWMSWREKTTPPPGVLVTKGSAHIAATRGFIGYILFNQTALDLLEWMKDVRVPDEHFFSTFNHNPHLGVPGAYKGDPDLKMFYTRLKVWETIVARCQGRWIRNICNFGVGDLYRFVDAKELFLNKFNLHLDPVAYECAEQWYINRTFHEPNPNFDLTFYKNLPFVKNHS